MAIAKANQPLELLRQIFPVKDRGGWGKSTRGGIGVEYQIRDRLVDAGFLVIRSAGSRGPFDLIAILPGKYILGIQSKRGDESCLSPVPQFSCFYPVLIRRKPGTWVVEPLKTSAPERSGQPFEASMSSPNQAH